MFHCPFAVAYVTRSSSVVPATITLKIQLYMRNCERIKPLPRRSELRVGHRILRLENLMASLLLSNASFVVATVSRFHLLDIVDKYSSTTLDEQLLNVVAKENIHVHTHVLVNLMLIGSCIRSSQPKRVFHMRHLAAAFADRQYDLSHKSIIDNQKFETLPPKSVKVGSSSIKWVFKAYILRPKCKVNRSALMCPYSKSVYNIFLIFSTGFPFCDKFSSKFLLSTLEPKFSLTLTTFITTEDGAKF